MNGSWKISSLAVNGQSFLVIDGYLLNPFPCHLSLHSCASYLSEVSILPFLCLHVISILQILSLFSICFYLSISLSFSTFLLIFLTLSFLWTTAMKDLVIICKGIEDESRDAARKRNCDFISLSYLIILNFRSHFIS